MAVRTNDNLKRHQREYKQDKCCVHCGQTLENELMTVDHIIPRSLYGKPNDERNWQVLCKDCHYLKTELENTILKGLEVPEEHMTAFRGLSILADKTAVARERLGLYENHCVKLNRTLFNKAHVYFNHRDLEN